MMPGNGIIIIIIVFQSCPCSVAALPRLGPTEQQMSYLLVSDISERCSLPADSAYSALNGNYM